ncbi:hypothetical protein [Methyloversatilis sp.]|uniref:hypothetical protein n=1 Tax=Methyloversatilis sp. TaxID=2569862 RepID=UPI003F70AB8F
MLRSKKNRASLARQLSRQKQASHPSLSKWDVWLPRLSHFAQFCLVLITVGSLYFTVIPLYQKAVLEEGIAKREVELKLLNDRLAIAYKRLRTNAVLDYQMLATPECAGLYSPPRTAKMSDVASAPKPSRAELVFSVDIRQCLLKVADEATPLADLSPSDRQQFNAELAEVIDRLEHKKQTAMAAYRSVPTELSDIGAQALPADSYRVQHLELIARIRGAQAVEIERRRLAAAIEKERIGSEYENAITGELTNLRKTNWRSDLQ